MKKKLLLLALMGLAICLIVQVPTLLQAQGRGERKGPPIPEGIPNDVALLKGAATPIPAYDGTVELFEHTWPEIRDYIVSGKRTTVLMNGGGNDQNGLYVIVGKHTLRGTHDTLEITKRLGNALHAQPINFSPQDYGKPGSSGDHMMYPGTLHIPIPVYDDVLRAYFTDMRRSGFKDVISMSDQLPGNRESRKIAVEMNQKWAADPTFKDVFGQNPDTHAYHCEEYYDTYSMADREVVQTSQGFHDSYRVTATVAAINPLFVRYDQRKAAGAKYMSINGIDITDLKKVIADGNRWREAQITVAVKWIQDRIEEHKKGLPPPADFPGLPGGMIYKEAAGFKGDWQK